MQQKGNHMKILTLSIMIANELKNMIEQENLKEGDKLPSERDLCEKLNVQRLTLRSGLRILLQEGIIVSRQRSGYYVNKPRVEKNVFHLESTSEAIFQQGLKMKIELLHLSKMELNKYLSGQMRLPLGTKVYELQRVRYVDDEPISLETTYLPFDITPNLERYDLETQALYEILASIYEISIDYCEQEILVTTADKFSALALHIEEGEQLVLQQGLAYDTKNRQIEYTESLMKMERFVYVN